MLVINRRSRGVVALRLAVQDPPFVPSITVRDVPEEVRDELAARVARSGRSLQEYLRMQLVALASRPDPKALLTSIRERKATSGSRLDARDILDHRDAERA